MPDLYFDREQSEAKHDILRRYLTPFAHKILSRWKSIDFIDGFAGPWDNVDEEELSDTSIGVALKTLSEVAESKGHSPGDRRIRCQFNEAKSSAFDKLEAFIDRSRATFPLLKIEIYKGKFADNADQICRDANHQFQLLFVDPTGYTGFPPSSLETFKGRSSEIIVNFMRSFIERFVSGDHADRAKALAGLVGQQRADFLLDTGLTIERLEAEYLSMLRGDLGYRYAAMSPIHNPDKNQIHFNLAYATHSPIGLEEMRRAEFAALSIHERRRFEKRDDSQTDDLFGGELAVHGPYSIARMAHRRKVPTRIRELLKDNPNGMPFSEVAAQLQQTLYLKGSEISDAIVEMAASGELEPSWLKRRGLKPRNDDRIVISG